VSELKADQQKESAPALQVLVFSCYLVWFLKKTRPQYKLFKVTSRKT
jgi:hypothetical protein